MTGFTMTEDEKRTVRETAKAMLGVIPEGQPDGKLAMMAVAFAMVAFCDAVGIPHSAQHELLTAAQAALKPTVN